MRDNASISTFESANRTGVISDRDTFLLNAPPQADPYGRTAASCRGYVEESAFAFSGEGQARAYIVDGQVGEVGEDFLKGHAAGQILKHIGNSDAHAADARFAAPLARAEACSLSPFWWKRKSTSRLINQPVTLPAGRTLRNGCFVHWPDRLDTQPYLRLGAAGGSGMLERLV